MCGMMYLPLNFRLPSMERALQSARNESRNESNTTASAFKHPLSATSSNLKAPDPLPPISSLRTEGPPGIPAPTRFTPYSKSFCGSGHGIAPPAHISVHAQRPGLISNIGASPAGASAFQGHHQSTPLPPASLPLPHFPSPSHVGTHPAFAFPMGLPAFIPGAPTLSHAQLQQMMAADGGIMAQYLNSCDPLARAALMEITRMGHYPLGKKLFGCPQCRYITDRKNNLKRHVATMHQDCEKVLECCGVMFKNKASLRDHVMIFHSNGYMCRFCGRNFCRKALLKRHLTVHSGQKDFSCEQCDYATSHKSNLERHRKVHERQGEGSDENSCDETSSEKGLHNTSNSLSFTEKLSLSSQFNSTGGMRGIFPEFRSEHLHLNNNSRHLDFSKHFSLDADIKDTGSHQKLKEQNANKSNSGDVIGNKDDSCLIDLEDEFELNNINVVDIDV